MLSLINPALAVLTIGFGLFGLIAPRFTAKALDFATEGSTMGLSELRASAGGLFVALGTACLWTGAPWAYGMLGVAYAGAGIGRVTSILIDRPPLPKAAIWAAFEILPAAWLIATNF
ncbi:DUF4345 family protein [Tropicibacter naphthalenivorans]|uniref:DUF4345 domain-containing protein n=1 Tax=Tropicibacter naphthalenivorans TaxID=441103 RepID=A0A0P1G7D1_9RHOB|nr:DUF4345 family protein [Tropicibacter naphthalenivorans]CUH77542.1 hypothetical protein TRN7648_01530 [Tropicibacter naphthalenivorans]SMC56446.1 protein of unknown function [Tropicibacter naphthalenivorans]